MANWVANFVNNDQYKQRRNVQIILTLGKVHSHGEIVIKNDR